MSGCRESCDSANEVREAFNTDDIDGTHNIHNAPNDHDVHSGRSATVLTGVLCAVHSSLPGGRAEARQIAADYV